jgi:hypothetical protein
LVAGLCKGGLAKWMNVHSIRSRPFFIYVDDAILCCPSLKVVDDIIKSLKDGFNDIDKGEFDDYNESKVTWPMENTNPAGSEQSWNASSI